MPMDDDSYRQLVGFVRVQLDEDELAARAAQADDYWHAWHESTLAAWMFKDDVAAHVRRLVPGRALAEVVFKRDLLHRCGWSLFDDDGEPLFDDGWDSSKFAARQFLQSMASVYADHTRVESD